MSPELTKSFERSWPELHRRLRALLARKKIPISKQDDIIQETGLRLFGMWERVDQSQPVWGLAVTIALNLMRDEARRRSDSEILGAVPDLAGGDDVERAGIARAELRRVTGALSQLSDAHRSVLLAEVGAHNEVPRRGPNATKMLRMRARRELTAILQKAQGLVALGAWRVRKYLTNLEMVGVRLSGTDAATASVGWVAAIALFSLPLTILFTPAQAAPLRGDRTAIVRVGNSPGISLAKEARMMRAADAKAAALAERRAHRGAAAAAQSTQPSSGLPVGGEQASGEAKISLLGNETQVGGGTGQSVAVGQTSSSCGTDCGVRIEAELCVKKAGLVDQCLRIDTGNQDPAPGKN